MKPTYAEDIVVAIKKDDCVEWYILDRDYCFLDYNKWEDVYRKAGCFVPEDDDERFGIKVLDQDTKDFFLEKVRECRVTTEELRKMLMDEPSDSDKLEYNASILIDFENRLLISYYPEPESFEDYTPDGWKGEYRDFNEEIPHRYRYWLDENGRNLIGG